MLRPILSVGIILAAIIGLFLVRPTRAPLRTLLGPQQVTEDIRLSKVTTDGRFAYVLLAGQDTCPFLNQFPKKLSDTKIQIWLLEADGTALVPNDKPSYQGARDAGCDSNVATFFFKAKWDPISLVVSINDVSTLYPMATKLR